MSFAEGVPTVEIQLGGKSYTLGWTWAAKRRLKESGINLSDQAVIAENLATVLWVSLEKDSRNDLSVEDIEEMIHSGNEVEVATRIGELFKVSEPDPDVKQEPAAVTEPTAGRSTSMISGQLASTT